MNQYVMKPMKQLELLEGGMEMKKQPRKRVDIVSVKLVKESSLLYDKRTIRSPEDGYELAKQYLGNVDREYFIVVSLDTKNRPTNITTCHIGNLNSSIVSVREVFKTAILSNSASIMCFHNHPSQDCTPSSADIEVTKRLVDAGKIIGIEVLDHIIVCENDYCSLREKSYI